MRMRQILISMMMVLLLTGCRTVSERESFVEHHKVENMMQRLDSLMAKSQTTVQDSSWRETVIKQLQSIKERNDTNRTTVVDSAGNVIRETITIVREREVESENSRLEREGLIHQVEKMDSVLSVQNLQISHMDSLMQASVKEKTIERSVPWYRQLWNNVRFVFIGFLIGIIFHVLIYRKFKKYIKL